MMKYDKIINQIIWYLKEKLSYDLKKSVSLSHISSTISNSPLSQVVHTIKHNIKTNKVNIHNLLNY